MSVLLPFRDAAATLGDCLASIRAQSLADFEALCIDDHSSDGGAARVAELQRRDPRFRLLAARGRGLVAALNQGLAQARAPLVARMDADDRMHPERLALQAQTMARDTALTVLGSRVEVFAERAISDGMRRYIDWQNRCITARTLADELYWESPLAHPSVMLRRGRVLAAGGYRDGAFPEDYELWLRLAAAGHRFGKRPEVLLQWRDGDRRASRTDPRYAREAFDRLRAHYLAADARVAHAAAGVAVWGAGRRTRQRLRYLFAAGVAPVVWIDIDRRKLGNRIGGATVVAPQWLARRPRPFVLSCVASHGARERIEAELARLGYRPGEDYLCVG